MRPTNCFAYLSATVAMGAVIAVMSAGWCQAALSTLTAIEHNAKGSDLESRAVTASLRLPWASTPINVQSHFDQASPGYPE